MKTVSSWCLGSQLRTKVFSDIDYVSPLHVMIILMLCPVADPLDDLWGTGCKRADRSNGHVLGSCEQRAKKGTWRAEERLLRCIEKNPYVGEPHVLLIKVYLGKKRFAEAERGLLLLLQWGSPWDMMSWEGRLLALEFFS
ncbi:hypothetical protein Bca52824_027493 [Brassica carinata]|uniref:Uncharacterized protein n=1 Tax=Brassica carinata TaxID=52824 RepID=A0A8X7VAK7_BRACI|nr:hypothetical protein Bca52824_027493 [Brassica carinata]